MAAVSEETLCVAGVRWRRYGPEAGDGTPLVIMHGLFGSGDNWRSQARALAGVGPGSGPGSGRTVYVADMPNHGESLHTERCSYPEIARLIWQSLDRMDATERVQLLGHSMGGKAAMAMALERPRRTERLVVVDIAPRVYPPRHEGIFTGMQAVAEAAPASRGEAERLLSRFIPEKPVRLFLLKSLVPGPTDHGGYRWKLNLDGIRRCYRMISDWPYESGTDHYPWQALFIRAGASPYVTDEDEDVIREFFPEARIATIAGAGHWVHAEQREQFLSVVREAVS